jgi:hypothetical protein
MSALFPERPFIQAVRQHALPACEWVMPSRLARRDYASVVKRLPPGMPDCLHTSTDRSEEGVGRCTAAIYGGRAYVIHYAFVPCGAA